MQAAVTAVLSVDGLGAVIVEVLGSVSGAHALRLRAAPVPVRSLHRLPGTLRREGAAPLRGLLVAVPADGGGLHESRLDFVEDVSHVARPEVVDETGARDARSTSAPAARSWPGSRRACRVTGCAAASCCPAWTSPCARSCAYNG